MKPFNKFILDLIREALKMQSRTLKMLLIVKVYVLHPKKPLWPKKKVNCINALKMANLLLIPKEQ